MFGNFHFVPLNNEHTDAIVEPFDVAISNCCNGAFRLTTTDCLV